MRYGIALSLLFFPGLLLADFSFVPGGSNQISFVSGGSNTVRFSTAPPVSGGGAAAPSYVSSNGANGTGATGVAFTFTGSANGAIGCVRVGADTGATFTDDTPRRWIPILDSKIDAALNHLVMAYSTGPFTGTPTLTVTPVSGTPSMRVAWHELSNMSELNTVNVSTSNLGNDAAPTSASFTTTVANAYVFACSAVTGSVDFTQGSNYTERQEIVQKISSEDRTLSATGSYTADYSISVSGEWGIGAAAIAGQN